MFRTIPEAHGRFFYPDYISYGDHNKSFSDFALFAFGMAVTSSELPATDSGVSPRVAGAIGFQLPQLLLFLICLPSRIIICFAIPL